VFLLFQRDIRELMFSRFGQLNIAASKHSKSPTATTSRCPREHHHADTASPPKVDPSPLLDAHGKATDSVPGLKFSDNCAVLFHCGDCGTG